MLQNSEGILFIQQVFIEPSLCIRSWEYGGAQDLCLHVAHKSSPLCSTEWRKEGRMTIHRVESVVADSINNNYVEGLDGCHISGKSEF